jgi:hypothetical protein
MNYPLIQAIIYSLLPLVSLSDYNSSIIPNFKDSNTKFQEEKVNEDKLEKFSTNQHIQICPTMKVQNKLSRL